MQKIREHRTVIIIVGVIAILVFGSSCELENRNATPRSGVEVVK